MRQCLLLPHPQSCDSYRVRSSVADGITSVERSEEAESRAYARGRPDAERQRLWEGSSSAALSTASPTAQPSIEASAGSTGGDRTAVWPKPCRSFGPSAESRPGTRLER